MQLLLLCLFLPFLEQGRQELELVHDKLPELQPCVQHSLGMECWTPTLNLLPSERRPCGFMQMKILYANGYVCKSPSFGRDFYEGDVKLPDSFLPPQFGSAIRTLYPNKTSLAKLLIACNEIFIDRCGDQSLYLRAVLLELPVTGGFRRIYLPWPWDFHRTPRSFQERGRCWGGSGSGGMDKGLRRLPCAPAASGATHGACARDVGCPGSPRGQPGALHPLWNSGGIVPSARAS